MSDNLKTSIVEFDSVSAQKWLDKFHFDFQRKPKNGLLTSMRARCERAG